MESKERVHVGRASLEGGMARYARSFNLLELLAERGRHPKKPGLAEWRRTVPEGFAFSVVVPLEIASLVARGPRREELLTHAEMVADTLDAAWWVLRTPPQVTPSARSIRELAELLERLSAGGRPAAWEPRGVWSDEVAQETAAALDVHLVRDLAREDRLDDAPVVYTRLRALGEGARIGAAAAERVAERLEGTTSAFVVVEGDGAGRVRAVLREMLGGEGPGPDELVAEEDDEDDEPLDDEDDQNQDEGDEEEDS